MAITEDEFAKLRVLWRGKTCGDIVGNQKAVVINGSISLEAACEVLVKNNILSAPVRDAESSALVGIFTYRVLLKALLARAAKHRRPEEFNMSDLLVQLGPKEPVSTIIAGTELSSVLPEDPLEEAVRKFGNRVHRTAVVSTKQEFLGMISQGMLLKYLQDNSRSVKEILDRSLKKLGMVKGDLILVANDSLVIDAVQLLIDRNISSVAVTNSSRAIIGNISLTDVKYILRGRHYHLFWLETEKFIGHVKREEAFSNLEPKDSYPVFTVHANKSLSSTIDRMVALQTHRLWIIENDFVPKGVISITDIMRLLTPPL